MPRKITSESLTIDYKTISSIPVGTRQKLFSSGLADVMAKALTPGQRVALFPQYYKDSLNTIAGQKSEVTPYSGTTAPTPGVTNYTPKSTDNPSNPKSKDTKTTATPDKPKEKRGITPSEFRKIESNPLLAGYGDRLGKGKNNTNSNVGLKDLTHREKAVIDMISKREGTSSEQGYNIILGDKKGTPGTSVLGAPPKPITQMTLNELKDWQTEMLNNPNNKWNSSAAGKGQFVRTTLFGKSGNPEGGLLWKMGIKPEDYDKYNFDENLQNKLTLQNFKDYVGDPNSTPDSWNLTGLQNQWESFDTRKGFAPLNESEISSIKDATTDVIQTETAIPLEAQKEMSAEDLAMLNESSEGKLNSNIPTATPTESTDKSNLEVKDSANARPVLKPIENPLDYISSRNPRGAKMEDVDPVLLKSYAEGIQQFEADNPQYKVEVFGPSAGVRHSGSTRNHGLQALSNKGGAVDWVIVDKESGKQLTNFNRPYPGQTGDPGETAPIYAKFHAAASLAQKHYFPDSTPITFGGGFQTGTTAFDLMHGDLTHPGGVDGYNRERGWSDSMMSKYNIQENVTIGSVKDQATLAQSIYGELDENGNYKNQIKSVKDENTNTSRMAFVAREKQKESELKSDTVQSNQIQEANELAKPVDESSIIETPKESPATQIVPTNEKSEKSSPLPSYKSAIEDMTKNTLTVDPIQESNQLASLSSTDNSTNPILKPKTQESLAQEVKTVNEPINALEYSPTPLAKSHMGDLTGPKMPPEKAPVAKVGSDVVIPKPVKETPTASPVKKEEPIPEVVPTDSMASGGEIKEPHTAINNRTGKRINLGEVGTGGEVVIPKHKINAAELGERKDSNVEAMKSHSEQKRPVTVRQAPSPLPKGGPKPLSNILVDHPLRSPTLTKAYARATMQQDPYQEGYVNFGHPLF